MPPRHPQSSFYQPNWKKSLVRDLSGWLTVKPIFQVSVQTRKIRDIVNKVSCLHSLDRLSLASELNKRLEQPLDCFVQVNISEEPNKQGIPANKVKTFIKQLEKFDKIRVIGLMCIAQLTFDEEILIKSFQKMPASD